MRELEADGLVDRSVHSQVPPRVDDSLTERGFSIVPVLMAIKDWGDRNIDVFAKRLEVQSATG